MRDPSTLQPTAQLGFLRCKNLQRDGGRAERDAAPASFCARDSSGSPEKQRRRRLPRKALLSASDLLALSPGCFVPAGEENIVLCFLQTLRPSMPSYLPRK